MRLARAGAPVTILFAAVGYLVSNVLGVAAMASVGTSCRADLTRLVCAYAPDNAGDSGVMVGLALGTALTLFVSCHYWRDRITHPFIATMAGLATLTLGFDTLYRHPIVQEARIVNDTMNLLGFIMLASFALTALVMRGYRATISQVAGAVAISFAAKMLVSVAFGLLRTGIAGGATELLLLFVVYTFGAFSIHLMAVGAMLVDARPVEAAAARIVQAHTAGATVNGLRGLAIVLVVIYHYVPTEFFSFSLGKPINSILFVVAGFYFAALLVKHEAALNAPLRTRLSSAIDLLVRRHVRIWPPLAIVVGLYLILSAVDHGALTQQIRTTWPFFLTYLGYVPRWIYEANAFPGHLWVVSAQETLLLLFFAAIVVAGLRRVQGALWMLVLIGFACRTIGAAAFFPDHPSLALETPLAVLDALCLGMLVRFQLGRRRTHYRLRRLLTLAVVGTASALALLPNTDMTYFGLAPVLTAAGTALVLVLSADEVRGRRFAGSLLASPVLGFLGGISFSLFLLHPLVNTVLRLGFAQATGIEMPWWLLLGTGVPLSVGAAWLFARWVEEPFKRVRKIAGPPSWQGQVAQA